MARRPAATLVALSLLTSTAISQTLPPPRPPALGIPSSPAIAAPVQEIAQARSLPAERKGAIPAPASIEDAVDLVNAYLNRTATLRADFAQVAGDGKRASGKVAIQRPGRMRFEYAAPATLEIVADGRSVAVRDRRLATQDLYSIGQTPLKFLVKENIDLARDAKVTGAASENGLLSLRLEDRATLGGTSKITIEFDLAAGELRGWRVVDPQGYLTVVTLRNVDTATPPDPSGFRINYERAL